MLKSMTGYGYSRVENENFIFTSEVKSLNSKILDLSIKLPKVFSPKEPELRDRITEILMRGKIFVEIEYQTKQDPISKVHYNKELFTKYYVELKRLADGVMADYASLFELAIKSPEVTSIEVSDEELENAWDTIRAEVINVIGQCDNFRIEEGKKLLPKFDVYISNINSGLKSIESKDNNRIERIRERVNSNLNDHFGDVGYDPSRFEQELLYYIEKLDIQEEKVRLKNHLDYFLEVLNSPTSMGKKLNFISQEIGREINTIGSKANDSAIQKIVVGQFWRKWKTKPDTV